MQCIMCVMGGGGRPRGGVYTRDIVHIADYICTFCCPNGNFFDGKIGSLSPRKASYNRVALPNPN